MMKRRLSSVVNAFYKFTPLVICGYCLFMVTYDFRAESLPAAVFCLILFGILAKRASRLKMKRRLSSIVSPFYKFTPLVILVILGYSLLTYDFRAGSLPTTVFCLLLAGILAKVSSRLKKVYLAGDMLYVSNYLRQIRIPLSEVASVEVSDVIWSGHPRTVAIRLRRPAEFGGRVVFIPRGFGYLAEDVVAEVRAAVEAQHNNGMHPTADTTNFKFQ